VAVDPADRPSARGYVLQKWLRYRGPGSHPAHKSHAKSFALASGVARHIRDFGAYAEMAEKVGHVAGCYQSIARIGRPVVKDQRAHSRLPYLNRAERSRPIRGVCHPRLNPHYRRQHQRQQKYKDSKDKLPPERPKRYSSHQETFTSPKRALFNVQLTNEDTCGPTLYVLKEGGNRQ
jgi:hypothetical protein